MSGESYSLYILQCADDSLYTGIARDVQNRIGEHQSGSKGAKYLRGRTPFKLVFEQLVGTRSAAQSLEHRIKKLSKAKKLALIAGRLSIDHLNFRHTSGSSLG
ncbi:MAG: GIY-YIG nuclease family protein [Gammaproteobacteria bacterium]|nr:GIY-YIG nuclease family protein [Gammaproteobacteria bacterium]